MDLDIKDVDLEWSDADYQNLITFSIFARMVRPQLMAVSCHAVSFYRAMHFSAKGGIAIACHLSVCPSVCPSVRL